MVNVADCLLPVKTAYMGISCTHCMTTPPDEGLVTCSRCKRAKYCNRDCQKADWKFHRRECKLLQTLRESKEYYHSFPGDTLLQKSFTLGSMLEESKYARRSLMFLRHYRSCSVCLKSDYDFAHSTCENNAPEWINCPTCSYGWCCSQEHWDEYKSRHSQEICDRYMAQTKLTLFRWQHTKKHNEIFQHIPSEVMTGALNVFPDSWNSYFQVRDPYIHSLSQQGRLPEEYLPCATSQLSAPVTCLYAMYQHGIQHFKELSDMTIHIVGASDSYEIVPGMSWEEILHCLPALKKLHNVFIGPEACTSVKGVDDYLAPFAAGCCPSCTAQSRARVTSFHGKTYHDYKATANEDDKPDLIVAFNTGMHADDVESWRTSLDVILDMDVPCFFTSYNHDEAVMDFAVLRAAGAKTLTSAPVLHPFPEDIPRSELDEGDLDKFYQCNKFGIAFKGRAV